MKTTSTSDVPVKCPDCGRKLTIADDAERWPVHAAKVSRVAGFTARACTKSDVLLFLGP